MILRASIVGAFVFCANFHRDLFPPVGQPKWWFHRGILLKMPKTLRSIGIALICPGFYSL